MKTKVNIVTKEKSSNVISVYLEKALDFEASRMVIDKVVDFLVKEYIKKNSAKILKKIDTEVVINMVNIGVAKEIARLAVEDIEIHTSK